MESSGPNRGPITNVWILSQHVTHGPPPPSNFGAIQPRGQSYCMVPTGHKENAGASTLKLPQSSRILDALNTSTASANLSGSSRISSPQDKTLFTFDSLILPGDTILTEPLAVHNRGAEHFDASFTGPAQALTGIHDPDTDWTTILTDETTFRIHCRTRQVPEDLTHIIWRAVQTPQVLPQIYDASHHISDVLQAGISWEEFHHHVTHMDTGTAAGWTGFTHAMMRSWAEPLMREVTSCNDSAQWMPLRGGPTIEYPRPTLVCNAKWTSYQHSPLCSAYS